MKDTCGEIAGGHELQLGGLVYCNRKKAHTGRCSWMNETRYCAHYGLKPGKEADDFFRSKPLQPTKKDKTP
jgi:hypothetical protein